MKGIYSKLFSCAALTLAFALFIGSTANAQDLKSEEIVAKHLESIGTKEKRDAAKNRLIGGASQFESKQPSKKTGGKVIMVSDANNLFFVSSFNSQEYPFEKIGSFAGKPNLPFVTAGTRSPLGAFLADHNKIISEGVLGGSLSSMWSLLNPQIKKGKLSSEGTKKIDGRKAHVLSYFVEGTAGKMTIKMFFDAENFHHVRTIYHDEVPPRDQPFGVLGVQAGLKLDITEDFGDFKTVEGLTLPHTYKIRYQTDSNSGVYEYNWNFTMSKVLFNQNLDAKFFTFD